MIRHASVLVAMSIGTLGFAGPLNPPAGPIASTGKTLTEVEPRTAINATNTPGDADSTFKITQPGAYYLTGNVTGASGKRGIEITANDVSIDLCGFTMTGVAGSLEAIGAPLPVYDVTVKNGTLTLWALGGVNLANSRNTLVCDVVVGDVLGVGIRVGFNSIVTRCTVDAPNGTGPTVAGIQAACCSIIETCHLDIADSGPADGIVVGDTCNIRNCIVNNCGGAGIRCTGPTNTVDGCTILFVGASGIAVDSDCVVRACNVSTASTDAILATGSDNRIERNNLRQCNRGIHVASSGNIVLGNTASGNTTNFDISAGNVGLYMNAATGGAFTGNAGGVNPGSADDNTNYAY